MRTPSQRPGVALPGGGRRRLVRGGIIAACILYVGILLLLPLAGIVYTALESGLSKVAETFTRPDVRHAFYLTGVITVITVIVTTVFGVVTAWVLVRQRFPGKSLLNALVDLPFALSPVTVGLAAVILFGLGGWLEPFFQARGIQILFALPSMVLVTIFICVPFTIREVVPVLEEIGTEREQAAESLGANALQRFWRITLPSIRWGIVYGVVLTLARSLGEFGAVKVVSRNVLGQTRTATLVVEEKYLNFDQQGAYATAFLLAMVSVACIVVVGIIRPKNHS